MITLLRKLCGTRRCCQRRKSREFDQHTDSEKYPVSDFVAWCDDAREEPIDSAMLLADFHRDKSILDALRHYVASYVSRCSLRLAYILVPERSQKPLFRFKQPDLDPEALQALRLQALRQHEANGGKLQVLFTGATGFLGQEFLCQVADNPAFGEIVCIVRGRDGQSLKEFKESVLSRLPIDPERYEKFKFILGDISQDNFGLSAENFDHLSLTVTHVIHCAASVSFESSYEESFENVLGARNACALAERFQKEPDSRFVSLVLIESCYIAGRQADTCHEDKLEFPADYFNNFYEVTKAFASIEGARHLARGLRVSQLCPSIIVGRAVDGVNHGDVKVCNAPINTFGRIHQSDKALSGEVSWLKRMQTHCISHLARHYPADSHGSLDLVCVDRVVQGMVAAVTNPEAVGHKIHLCSHPEEQFTMRKFREILREEIGVKIRFVHPVVHRWVRDPLIAALLKCARLGKALPSLRKLTKIFAAYSEWGQPKHEVGKDLEILGLGPRLDMEQVMRTVMRHNQYVQQFGKVRGEEVYRRERLWEVFCQDLLSKYAVPMLADIPAATFHSEVQSYVQSLEKISEP